MICRPLHESFSYVDELIFICTWKVFKSVSSYMAFFSFVSRDTMHESIKYLIS